MPKKNKYNYPDEKWVMELEKGQFLSKEDLMQIFKFDDAKDARFAYARMGLVKHIEKIRENNDCPVVVKGENYGLRIMPDNEASYRCAHKFDGCIDKMEVLTEKHGWVNQENLSIDERLKHRKDHHRMGLINQSIIREKRRIRDLDPN